MYCTAPLSPRKGRLRSFHDDDDDDDNIIRVIITGNGTQQRPELTQQSYLKFHDDKEMLIVDQKVQLFIWGKTGVLPIDSTALNNLR